MSVFPSLNCLSVSGPAEVGGIGQRMIGFTLKLLLCPGNVMGEGSDNRGSWGAKPSGLSLLNESFNDAIRLLLFYFVRAEHAERL